MSARRQIRRAVDTFDSDSIPRGAFGSIRDDGLKLSRASREGTANRLAGKCLNQFRIACADCSNQPHHLLSYHAWAVANRHLT